MDKYLDYNGLLYLKSVLEALFAAKEDIPSKVSELTNDSGYITLADVPDTGVTKFNGRTGEVSPQTGDYTAEMVGALPDTTTIPDALADLTDDATHRLVTDTLIAAWNGKATKQDIDDAISALGSVFNFKGEKASVAELPTDATAGDVYLVKGQEYVAIDDAGTIRWEAFGVEVDLSGYLKKTDIGAISNEDIDTIFAS